MLQKYSDELIQKVWEKGTIVPGREPSQIRKDVCGALISRSKYGDRSSRYNLGWEIDHIVPGGPDDLSNLRPLQWYNNASRQDGKLTCPVKAR